MSEGLTATELLRVLNKVRLSSPFLTIMILKVKEKTIRGKFPKAMPNYRLSIAILNSR